MHAADSHNPESSLFEIDLATEKLKNNHKIPRFSSEWIQPDGGKMYEEIYKHIVFIWKNKELPQEWK